MATTTPRPKDPLNPTLEEAAEIISGLVSDFGANAKYYLSTSYQEAEVRKDFIDKFLFALGWDVNHEIQKNPFQQEVKVERNVQMATAQRRADYALALQPHFDSPVLYIEAKKPCGDIASPDNYFQIIRYANQRGHAIGILTDFEQLHVIDCRFQANIDTAIHRHLEKYHYTDYINPEKFARIFFLFSRPAVADGSIDKYAETLPKPKGRPGQKAFFPIAYRAIDELLLNTLDDLRGSLARGLKNQNPQLDSLTLTELTQRILDRLVFIRFLEDKLIEPAPIIPKLGESSGRTAWQDFLAISRRLDKTYNGIVFKYHSIIDDPNGLDIDEKVFADILDAFDYHKSKYLFNDIPLHILGSIYERFLGNVIVATSKRAKVDLKPEVRKAGGVYYTPKYIVDYIVQNTVGKLIEDKTPDEIAKMRFADIACGSGSFLLGVYDCLLKYITHWYNQNPIKAPKKSIIKREGVLHLSLEEKGRILINNIYGVDIDPQAVEVAQLSLFLKLLEEETTASARQFVMDFHRPLLPSLAENIKCGNSLVGRDILKGQMFPTDEEKELKPMDFEYAFPEVMKRGGFDAIVGNPPYIQLSMEAFRNEITNKYLRKTYRFSGGRLNTFAFFIERARQKTREGGKLSYIVPNTILTQEYYEDLRRKIIQHTDIDAITLPEGQVFQDAVVETAILVLGKHSRQENEISKNKVVFARLTKTSIVKNLNTIIQSDLAQNYNASLITPLNPNLRALKDKLEKCQEKFGRWLNINQAIALKHDRAACLTDQKKTKFHREILDGRHIGRFFTGNSPNYFKFELSKIHSCKREDIFLLPEKILFRRVGESLIASIDTQRKFALNTLVVISAKPDCPYNLRYILGLFNSKILNFYYVNFLKSSKKVFSEIQARQVAQMPFPSIDLCITAEKQKHDELVAIVEKMLASKKALCDARTDRDKNFYAQTCEAIDHQIDYLVYDLYGLTEEEIIIVEETLDMRTHQESQEQRKAPRKKSVITDNSSKQDIQTSKKARRMKSKRTANQGEMFD